MRVANGGRDLFGDQINCDFRSLADDYIPVYNSTRRLWEATAYTSGGLPGGPYIPASEKGAAGGVAVLDGSGKVPEQSISVGTGLTAPLLFDGVSSPALTAAQAGISQTFSGTITTNVPTAGTVRFTINNSAVVVFRDSPQKLLEFVSSVVWFTGTTTVTAGNTTIGRTTYGQAFNLQVGYMRFSIADVESFRITTSGVQLAEGLDFHVGTATGSKVFATNLQKGGFWGATPVVQQAGPATPGAATAGAAYGATEQTMLQTVYDAAIAAISLLKTIGLMA